jgi:tetratricopeptide (TPR) repeat protein
LSLAIVSFSHLFPNREKQRFLFSQTIQNQKDKEEGRLRSLATTMFLGNIFTLFHFLTGDRPSSNSNIQGVIAQTSSSLRDALLTYEICLSPGCVADGADETLSRMHALAPPDAIIKPGVCCSLCGNGPIVLEGSKKIRKVSEKKIIDMLFGDEGMDSQQQAVFDAFNLVSEANGALKQKDYEKATDLYKNGIDLGLEPALVLEERRIPEDSDTSPPGLQWLINARQQEGTAKLNIGDVDGAVSSAQSACDLSQNSSLDAFEALQEAYAAKGDAERELKTLQSLFALPEPEKMTAIQSNKRRQLGFRLAKLEREAKA